MILLTGGTGSLGSVLRERLLEKNYPVRVMTRGVEDWRGGGGVGQLRQRGIDTVLVDLRNVYRREDIAKQGFRYFSIGRPDHDIALQVVEAAE